MNAGTQSGLVLRRGGIANADRIDVDFTLAIHNRTGKYFIGRELLAGAADLIGRIYYGPLALDSPPAWLIGRLLGRFQYLQTRAFVQGMNWGLPRRRSRNRVLHLDPFTVGSTALREGDVVLCHDIGPITHPELFDPHVCEAYRAIYAEIASVRPYLVFVSQASRAAFRAHWPAGAQLRDRVIYPAIHVAQRATATLLPGIGEAPFLLTVGSIGDRKNQLSCIEAFERSGLHGKGFQYLLCGAREPGFELVENAAARTPGVTLLPYVTDGELSWLYGHASGFVLASKLEGFGMPVAEAIGCGLVPAVTAGTVLHEVAGDGALLMDAEDVDSIAAAMTRIAEMSDGERIVRCAALRSSIERFTPERFVEQWRSLITEVLASRHHPLALSVD